MKNNFKCPCCDKEYFIPNYSITIRNGKSIYKEKNNSNSLVCDCRLGEEDVVSLIPIEKDVNYSEQSVMFFNSLSPEQKKQVLLKRDAEHNKKNSGWRDKNYYGPGNKF